VIDDIEFQGKTEKKMQHPFIEFKDIKYVSWILNNIAYRVFYNPSYESAFTDDFKINIKKAIVALYDRDTRL
jgi:quinol-cytochrome oxidoreductase complex cytochrome b subunit